MIDLIADTSSWFTTTALNGLWQAALVAAAIAILLKLRARNGKLNATTTCAVVTAALFLSVTLHFVSIPEGFSTQSASLQTAVAATTEAQTDAGPSLPVVEPTNETSVGSSLVSTAESSLESPQTAHASATDKSPWRSGTLAIPFSERALPLGAFLLSAWLLVAVALLLRLAHSTRAALRLKREGQPVAELEHLVGTLQSDIFDRNVGVVTHPEISIPIVVGLGRPAIVIPEWTHSSLDSDELEQILLHELAHVRRFDDYLVLIQRVVEATFFFNPAILWLGRKLDHYRELACDDKVVSRTRKPHSYAASLGRMAEMHLCHNAMPATAGMANGKGTLVERIRRLLKDPSILADKFRKEEFLMAGAILAVLATAIVIAIPSISISFDRGSADHVHYSSFVFQEVPDVPDIPDIPDLPDLPPLPDIHELPPVPPIPIAHDAHVVAHTSSDLSITSWKRLLQTVSSIPSDGDKARVLVDAVKRMPTNGDVYTAFLKATDSVNSSSDRGRVLKTFIKSRDQLPWTTVIASATGIPSDSEKAAVLLAVSDKLPPDSSLRNTLIDAAESIGSPTSHARVLRSIGKQ